MHIQFVKMSLAALVRTLRICKCLAQGPGSRANPNTTVCCFGADRKGISPIARQCHLAVGAKCQHKLQPLQNSCLVWQATIRPPPQFDPWDDGPILQCRKLQPLPLRHSVQAPVKALVINEDQFVAREAGVVIGVGPTHMTRALLVIDPQWPV